MFKKKTLFDNVSVIEAKPIIESMIPDVEKCENIQRRHNKANNDGKNKKIIAIKTKHPRFEFYVGLQ